MSNVTNNYTPKRKLTEAQIAGLVLAGTVTVTALVLRRRWSIKTGKMLLLAAEGAVNEWVTELESNGFRVLVLSNGLVDKLVSEDKLSLAAA